MFASARTSKDLIRVKKIFGETNFKKQSLDSILTERLPDVCTEWFEQAGIPIQERIRWIRTFGIQCFLLLFIGVAISLPAGIMFGIVCTLINILILGARSFRRTLRFEKDYPAFLLSLRSSVRTGHDPIVAFENTKDFFHKESPLRKEIEQTVEKLHRGAEEEQAIGNFGKSIKHPDVALFRTGFLLSRQHGSSLAPCLERLVRTTRQRQSFRRKIASAVAMQKLSSFGVAACALFVPLMQFVSNPSDLITAWNHPLGGVMLGIGAGCVVGGLFWMLCMTRRKL